MTEVKPEVSGLSARLRDASDGWHEPFLTEMETRDIELMREAADLLDECKKVVEPIALVAEIFGPDWHDSDELSVEASEDRGYLLFTLQVGQFRAARALLSRLKGEGQVSPSHVETAEERQAKIVKWLRDLWATDELKVHIKSLADATERCNFDRPTERDNG